MAGIEDRPEADLDGAIRIQGEPISKENLSSYAGQWVALRDGWVVDSHPDSPLELRRNPDLVDTDRLFLVPNRAPSRVIL